METNGLVPARGRRKGLEACTREVGDGRGGAMAHEFLTSDAAGCLLTLKVVPRSSRTEWAGWTGPEAKLRIQAPPVDGAANEAVLEFVARTLGCHRRQVELVRGGTSRRKVVRVGGVTREWVMERLPGGG